MYYIETKVARKDFKVKTMEKIWLSQYQAGVPAEINADAYSSLVAVFLESCTKFKNKPALQNFGAQLTYAKWEETSRYFAAFLQQRLQLQKGERVAFMMPNILQYPVALFGVLRAGLVGMNVNPLYTVDELVYQLNDSETETVVVLENFAHVVAAAMPKTKLKHVIVTRIGDFLFWPKGLFFNFILKYIKKSIPVWHIPGAISFKNALREGAQSMLQSVDLSGQDLAFLQYTGGTTGVVKGAMLTHRNMVANLAQAHAWVQPALKEGEEIIITALPLYHVFSLLANCLLFMTEGALNVLITNPKDIPGFVKEMAKIKFTAITGVNTLFNALLHHPQFAKLDFSHFRVALSGGMPLQEVVAVKWKQVTGVPLLEAYGLTETSPAVTISPLYQQEYTSSSGLPVPSTDISIRDDADHELGIDAVGELCVKGPQVMRGYWRKPEETQQVLSADGWLRTGDMARVDKLGFVYLVDRKKDMIIVSGFKVYPNEVEQVIAAHPGVLEVGVVGVLSRSSGERVKAFIVKKEPTLTAKEIIDYCHQHLTSFKVPKEIEFCESLPKTNVGKILRRELR